MKIKNLLIAAVLLLITSAKMNATDLCVAENGTGGCYSTITDAINAASNGDRIIINPKAGNAPYAENLTITKTLQFLCNVEGAQYTVSGNITITPAVNRTVVFIGMNNLQGTITSIGNSPAGARCKVSIMNCNFENGSVDLDFDNFDVTVASNVFFDGNIKIRYGKVIGNDITTINNYYNPYNYYRCSVFIGTDVTPTNDSILIVGNKISNNNNASYFNTGIYGSTANQFYYIDNNFVTTTTNVYLWGVYINTSKNSILGRNSIVNNTVSAPLVPNFHGIEEVSSTANSYFDVVNNLILAQAGTGINVYSSGTIQVSYNLMNNPLTLTGITDDGTNNLSSNTTLDLTGHPNGGTDAINGGSPDEAYYDINLTRNDAGAYGGSFTLDNFYPVTGAARVYFVRAPRKITLGSTLNVKGDSFDR